jgi:hypothetical protein
MSQENKKFVIQQHLSGPDVHWDFMFELGDILQTYRLDKAPSEALHLAVNATKIFDHPLKFLTYQGPVNKGQGSVRIIETGTYKMVHQAHPVRDPKEKVSNGAHNRIELDLSGKILKGKFTLTHIEGDNWQFGKSNI